MRLDSRKLRAMFVVSVILILVVPTFPVVKGNTSEIWPMFRENLSHTGRSIYSITENPGKLLWRYRTDGMVRSSPALSADGTIYIGSDDGYLYALNRNGTLRWRYRAGAPVHSSPAVTADTIYFGSDDGYLYALNINGTLRWRFRTDGAIWSSPMVFRNNVFFGSDDGNLYSITTDGKFQWKFETGHPVRSSPAIASDGTIYFGSDRLYSLMPNGTLSWSFSASSDFYGSPLIGPDGTIYATCTDGRIYALHPNGTQIWSFKTGDSISSSPAMGAYGTIYVGSRDGFLYAIRPDGTLLWKTSAGGAIWWSSPAVSSEGMIVVGNYKGELMAWNESGTLRWRFSCSRAIWSSPIIAPDGAIYVGSEDGYVYAIWKGRPSPPTEVRAYASVIEVNITWSPPKDDGGSPIIKYEIYKGKSSGKEELIASVGSWKNYYIDKVSNGNAYYYYVVAVNDIGKSRPSPEMVAKMQLIPPPPQSLRFKVEDGAVNITWSPPSEDNVRIERYLVYRGSQKGEESYIGSTERTYFIDRNVSTGRTYYYYVKAVNDMGESEKSEELEVNLKEAPPILLYVTIGLAGIGALLLFLRWRKRLL